LQNPYLQNFDRILTLYAQHRNISKEEAIDAAIEEFDQIEISSAQSELKGTIMESIQKAENNENEWIESGDKEKYPHLYAL